MALVALLIPSRNISGSCVEFLPSITLQSLLFFAFLCLPQTPLIEYEGVFKVAEMVESVSLDMKSEGMFGIVVQDRIHIFQSFQCSRQPHLREERKF